MLLTEKFYLCYLDNKELFAWIKENNLNEKEFSQEKKKWENKTNRESNFFSDTELLLIYQDIILLKVFNDNHVPFLAKNYKLEYQIICQRVFQEKKNIIIISDKQWKEKKDEEKLLVLFKDKEIIEKNLREWLEKANN